MCALLTWAERPFSEEEASTTKEAQKNKAAFCKGTNTLISGDDDHF